MPTIFFRSPWRSAPEPPLSTAEPISTPEPSGLALVGTALAALGVLRAQSSFRLSHEVDDQTWRNHD